MLELFEVIRRSREHLAHNAGKSTAPGSGDAFLLENPAGRVTGSASLVEVDSYYEQHTQILDLFARPAYLAQIPDLLTAIVDSAAQSNTVIQAYVAETDHEKRWFPESAVFQEEVRLRNRLRTDSQPLDLLLYRLVLDDPQPFMHLSSEYYGKSSTFHSR